jgi:Zn-dependent protease with chaperone function
MAQQDIAQAYPTRNTASQALAFPKLDGNGAPVRAKDYVARGTGFWLGLGWLFIGLVTIFTFGLIWLLLGFGLIVEMFTRKKLLARIKGSHLKLGPDQFPELYDCIKNYSNRLGLKAVPDAFIIESSELNAIAFKIGARESIAFVDDVLWGALDAGKPEAIKFLVGHELAHHALGHTGTIRFMLSQAIFPLARYDELSADAVGMQLTGSRDAACEGLIMLTVGPQLLKYVNRDALLRQAQEVAADKQTKKGEAGLHHPVILRRLHALFAPR